MFRNVFLFALWLFSVPLFSANGDYAKLLKKCDRRLSKNPANYPAAFNKGYALYKLGKYEEAYKNFKTAYLNARTQQQKAMVRYNIGNTFFLQKKLKEALKEYRLGLIFDSDDEDLKYNYTVTKMLLEAKKQKKNKNSRTYVMTSQRKWIKNV